MTDIAACIKKREGGLWDQFEFVFLGGGDARNNLNFLCFSNYTINRNFVVKRDVYQRPPFVYQEIKCLSRAALPWRESTRALVRIATIARSKVWTCSKTSTVFSDHSPESITKLTCFNPTQASPSHVHLVGNSSMTPMTFQRTVHPLTRPSTRKHTLGCLGMFPHCFLLSQSATLCAACTFF